MIAEIVTLQQESVHYRPHRTVMDTASSDPQRTVLFIDVLGVATASESFDSHELGRLNSHVGDSASQTKLFKQRAGFTSHTELWLRAVTLLPGILAHAKVLLFDIDGLAPEQVHVFSDSAFVVFREADTAALYSSYTLALALEYQVPMRGGLASGDYWSFTGIDRHIAPEKLREQVDPAGSEPERIQRVVDNVASYWKLVEEELAEAHLTRFIGSAVTRAYRAEQCGLKGVRIFVTKTCRDSLRPRLREVVGPLFEAFRDGAPDAADHRLLAGEIYWPLVLAGWRTRTETDPRLKIPFAGAKFKEHLGDRVATHLRHHYDPGGTHMVHYDATYRAWLTMRNYMGREKYDRYIPEMHVEEERLRTEYLPLYEALQERDEDAKRRELRRFVFWPS